VTSKNTDLVLRSLRPDEDFVYLTQLLRRAYQIWADQGLRFQATHQPPEKTKDRCAEGHTIIAELSGKVIGLVTVNDPKNSAGVHWYEQPGVTSFHQFAVDPDFQKKGIGSILLKECENQARSLGLRELALDTSEHAEALIQYYLRKGFRKVDEHRWNSANYKSVVLSKTLV